MLHRLPAKLPPSINPPQFLADRFVEIFTEKIVKILSTFLASLTLQHISPDSLPPPFPCFSTVTEDHFPKSSKSLQVNHVFLILGLDYLDIVITPMTSIISASLEQGKCFKQAYVTPILKKLSLDKKCSKITGLYI